jgi:hypothetical protein
MSAARRWLDDKPNQYNPVLLALIDIQRDLVKREVRILSVLKNRTTVNPQITGVYSPC